MSIIDNRCTICGEFFYGYGGAEHRCPPQWDVFIVDYDDEGEAYPGKRIYACDAQEAAEKRAERYDEEDHEMCGGHPIKVRVTDMSGKAIWFMVYGEVVPEYTAREIES
jgi:hypothetical protein